MKRIGWIKTSPTSAKQPYRPAKSPTKKLLKSASHILERNLREERQFIWKKEEVEGWKLLYVWTPKRGWCPATHLTASEPFTVAVKEARFEALTDLTDIFYEVL